MPRPPRAAGLRVARIEHHQGEVGALQFGARAAHAFALDRIAALAQAGGVDQGQFQPVEAHGFAQQVAGGAGDVGDDGAFAAGQRIQQRTLAGVGRAHDHRMQAVAQAAAAFGIGAAAAPAPQRVTKPLRTCAPPSVSMRFVGEIDRRLHMHAQADKLVGDASHAAREHAVERAPGRARRARVAAAIRSAMASAWARSSLPLRKARSVNSPGRARRAPERDQRATSCCSTTGLPCACSSTTSSPV